MHRTARWFEIRSWRFGASVTVGMIAVVLLLAAGSHANATGVCLFQTKQSIFTWPSLFWETDTGLKPTTFPTRPNTVLDIRIERTGEATATASVTRIRSPGVPETILGKNLHLGLQCFVVPPVGAEGTIRGTLFDENAPIPSFSPDPNVGFLWRLMDDLRRLVASFA